MLTYEYVHKMKIKSFNTFVEINLYNNDRSTIYNTFKLGRMETQSMHKNTRALNVCMYLLVALYFRVLLFELKIFESTLISHWAVLKIYMVL